MSLERRWIEEDCIHVEYCDLGCCKVKSCSCYDCGYYETNVVVNYQHKRKPFEGHYPDKNEAKLLRRIMSQTGLTEAEVRARKKCRIMLSETQKQNKPKLQIALENSIKTDTELANLFQVSVDSIRRWKQGKNLPHRIISLDIIDTLNEIEVTKDLAR